MMAHIRGLLFDLDGTLVDTAPDLLAALMLALADVGSACQASDADVKLQASNGSLAMLRTALPNHSDEQLEPLRLRMLQHYGQVNGQHSRVFSGLETVLLTAQQHNIGLGVVTNKPAQFTRPLLARLGLSSQLLSVVSADTTQFRKPHPAPMRLAAQQLNLPAQQILYVGDARRDIDAANAVAMPSAAALWGYIAAHDTPANWGATALLQTPQQLLGYLT